MILVAVVLLLAIWFVVRGRRGHAPTGDDMPMAPDAGTATPQSRAKERYGEGMGGSGGSFYY
ncbi:MULTISPECIES: hypothetical protein [unclassified Janibacter]|uniref:hypothetical protein n=1 Tax=unclassified Janibacter TaxID=2649294 RepID=UPI003CFE3B73